MDEIDQSIRRILGKLEQARRGGFKCFGSDKHRFKLNPPLSEQAVAAFEATHGVRLPEDYRRFLIAVGNGGVGPSYGILPLEGWSAALWEEPPGCLTKPSPLRPSLTDGADLTAAFDCTEDELFQGALAVNEQGCTFYGLLIVTGSYRGRVVNVDEALNGAPYFVHHPDFLSWYERWLDEMLADWEGGPGDSFGTGLPGSETDLVQTILHSPDGELRAEALRSLRRVPTLDDESSAAVRAALSDADAGARYWAVVIVKKHLDAEALPGIRRLLSDADAHVRSWALWTYWLLAAPDRAETARAMLADPEDCVVRRAVWLLRDEKTLRWSDLTPLLKSTDAVKRGTAVYALKDAIEDAAADFAALLADPDTNVRIYAVQSSGPAHLDLLVERAAVEHDDTVLTNIANRLGQARDRRATAHFIARTRHDDPLVRKRAAEHLTRLGDPAAIPALTALLIDHWKMRLPEGLNPFDTIAQAARKAIGKLSGRR